MHLNVPQLILDIKPHSQEAQRSPIRINKNKHTHKNNQNLYPTCHIQATENLRKEKISESSQRQKLLTLEEKR